MELLAKNTSLPTTIQLAVVTRRQLDADALTALLLGSSGFSVLCTTISTNVASAVGRYRHLDVVVLDATLVAQPGGQSVDSLIDEFLHVPIMLIDNEVNNCRLAAVMNAPHIGYFTRAATFSDLAAGIRLLAGGACAFDPAAKACIHQTPSGWQIRHDPHGEPFALLTPRELEVFKLIAKGSTVSSAAALLGLAPSTVDNHKARLMKKLGVHKALDLTRLAIRGGYINN
jgi:DNA-binding NarL/FixJ family response regulator